MNLRVAIASALLTIALFVPGRAVAAGAYPFDGIPGISPEQHLEAVVLIEDLRALRAAFETQREHLLKTEIGKAYFSAEHQKALLGFDVYAQLDHLIAIAAPKGAPIPAVVAFVSSGEDIRAQIAIKTEAGVAERLLAVKSTKGLRANGTPQAFTVTEGTKDLPAKVDGSWLRIGITEADLALTGTAPLKALPPTFAKWAADSHIVIAALGGGKLAETLAGMVNDNPMGQGLIRSTRAFGLTLRYDQDGSQVARLVLDADGIKDFAPMLARPPSQTSAAARWDAQALRAFQFALPPSLMPTMAMLAQTQLGETPDPALSALVQSIAGANGTFSAASFGAPNDWSASIGFVDEPSAKKFVENVNAVIAGAFEKYGVEKGLLTTAKADNGSMLSLRPDVSLSATTVTSFGPTVHITRQASRIARAQKLEAGKDGQRLIDGPLTPAVRDVLNRNAFLQGYAVSGADGSSFDLFYWPAKIVEVGLKHYKDMIPQDGATAFAAPAMGGLSRLPLTLAVGAYGFASIYDIAFSLDVDDSALVLQTASSRL